MYNKYHCKLQLLAQTIRTYATPDTKIPAKKKTLINNPLVVAKKYVETYSSSYAAARDPEERVQNK